MAYSDPQSVTNGSAISLPRTGQGMDTGTFTSSDSTSKLTVTHRKAGRTFQRRVRYDFSKIVADPLATGTNLRISAMANLSINVPENGFTVAEQVQLITAITTWLTATSNANATKLVGGES